MEFNTIKIDFIPLILGMTFLLLMGYAIGYFLRKLFTEYQIKEAEVRRQKIIKETEKEVESRFKIAEIEAKEASFPISGVFQDYTFVAHATKEMRNAWLSSILHRADRSA